MLKSNSVNSCDSGATPPLISEWDGTVSRDRSTRFGLAARRFILEHIESDSEVSVQTTVSEMLGGHHVQGMDGDGNSMSSLSHLTLSDRVLMAESGTTAAISSYRGPGPHEDDASVSRPDIPRKQGISQRSWDMAHKMDGDNGSVSGPAIPSRKQWISQRSCDVVHEMDGDDASVSGPVTSSRKQWVSQGSCDWVQEMDGGDDTISGLPIPSRKQWVSRRSCDFAHALGPVHTFSFSSDHTHHPSIDLEGGDSVPRQVVEESLTYQRRSSPSVLFDDGIIQFGTKPSSREAILWRCFLLSVLICTVVATVVFSILWKNVHNTHVSDTTITTISGGDVDTFRNETFFPSSSPTFFPSMSSSYAPSTQDMSTKSSSFPSTSPTILPSVQSVSAVPSAFLSSSPTFIPTMQPMSTVPASIPSSSPTFIPTIQPSSVVSSQPSEASAQPTIVPSQKKEIWDLLQSKAPESCAEMRQNPESPQALAFRWLVNHTPPPQEIRTKGINMAQRWLQRFALATLYYSTNGAEWLNVERWLDEDVDECLWFNHAPSPCNLKGQIVDLNLAHNGLNGSLPAYELGLLSSSLRTLRLEQNHLKGNIPKELGNLTLLEDLNLSYNDLKGRLPTALDQLVKLVSFTVAGNQGLDRNIPNSFIRNAKSVRKADFSYTDLEGTLEQWCDRDPKFELLAANCSKVKCSCCTKCCAGKECVEKRKVVGV